MVKQEFCGRRKVRPWSWMRASRLALVSALLCGGMAQAAFVNGNFEAGDLSGWTSQAWTNNGTQANPQRLSELKLQPPQGKQPLNEIVSGAENSLQDALWKTGDPLTDLGLPLRGNNSARINLLANASPRIIPRSGGVPSGWSQQTHTASSIAQEVELGPLDVDQDGKIHIRFIAAPVLDDSSTHGPVDRPYFAISLVKTYDARTGTDLSANPQELFFKYHYAGQPGAPWKWFTDAGGVKQSYTDPQAYDVAPGNAILRVGDKVRLQAVASACSAGGHSGHLYVDNFDTVLPKGLWITASAPQSVSNANGTQITYTYTYTNTGTTAVDDVKVNAAMPQDSAGASTTFASITPNSGGSCTAPAVGSTSPAACDFGTLQPGQSGTFTMVVTIPNNTAAPQVNNGDYNIGGHLVANLLGAMVQTQLLGVAATSDMVPDASGLPPTGGLQVPYSGSFSCKNTGAVDATQATCDATGLPPGLAVGQCTIDGNAWLQPGTVPAGKEVVCQVSGTPTGTPGSSTVTVGTSADNDLNPANNGTVTQIALSAAPDMAVDLGGLPTSAAANQPYSGSFSCRNQGSADATGGTLCAVTGLPSGVTQGACTIQPGNAAWVAGNAVAQGATVTCQVSGTPTATGATAIVGTTGATGDLNPANNTASFNLTTGTGAPDMAVDLGSLPVTFSANTPYSGSISCRNQGTAAALSGTSCTVTGLPPGVTVGACSLTPGGGAWTAGAPVPAGASVSCSVGGTPTTSGALSLVGTTGADGDPNWANNRATRNASAATQAVPTLSEWGMVLLSALLGLMGWRLARRRGTAL
ncbi:MAG: IPTL-CTERM sorting domain-containing protein [Burkholderiaceae bacterium]|jgi:hypothetical protein|nr:IPTL-CTERM sorting domain-containing protein [Burkholderiaceae bacterium]